MRARPTKIALALALVVVAGVLAGSCRHPRRSADGSRLDVRLTGGDSPEDIENMIRASLAEIYSPTNIAGSYTMHQVTNGPARWVFIQVGNAPRGLNMFNLYCYEQEKPGNWLLRAYVPVNAAYYTNSLDRELHIQTDDDSLKVLFRGAVIFTSGSQQKLIGGVPKMR